MFKSVIFDWGGVLIDDPLNFIMNYLAGFFGVDKDAFVKVFDEYYNIFDRGEMSEEEIWKNVSKDLKSDKVPSGSLWFEAFEKCYSPKLEVFDFIKKLKSKGIKVGLLSNTELPALKFFDDEIYSVFDFFTFSCKEGVMKPSDKIYEIALKNFGFEPSEVVFVDDRFVNVEGAKRVGMRGVLFENSAQAIREIEEILSQNSS